ncbi:MAG: SUR7/PalI family protein [Gemmataceae bacterium]|nr:SUR7/PalI family protein [Gemmataceae bacterium]
MSSAAPPPVGEFEYKPISGWALAGFLTSCFFALIVLVAAGIALLKGTPLFFPAWMLLPAVIGFILCYVALGQIQSSDGILAGAALARYGMWIALLSGLGYGAYVFMVGMAVTQQAETFLASGNDSFFGVLQKGKDPAEANAAFLMTQVPTMRQGVRISDAKLLADRFDVPEGPVDFGRLTAFRRHWLVRTLADGGAGDSKVESIGTKDWKYESKSFQVSRTYRITGPEVVATVALTAESQDLEDGRQWFVNWNRLDKMDYTPTPFGLAMNEVRRHGYRSLGQWLKQDAAGKDWDIDFTKLDETNWRSLLPDHPEAVKHLQKELMGRFAQPSPRMLEIPPDVQTELTPYEKLPGGQIRVDLPVLFRVLGASGIANYNVRLAVRADTVEKVDPQAIPKEYNLVPAKLRVIAVSEAVEPKKGKGPG